MKRALDHHGQPREPALADVVGRALLHHLDRVFFADHTRDHDERRVRGRAEREPQCVGTVEADQAVVGQDDVDVVAHEPLQQAVFVGDDIEHGARVGGAQTPANQLGVEGGVFDQHDAQRREPKVGPVAAVAHAGCARIVKPKVAPTPGSPCARTVPPWRSTMRRTLARPMPVPSNSSLRCRRWNTPNSRSAKRI